MIKRDLVTKEIEKLKNEAVSDLYVTSLKKQAFINEIRNGLGNEIKQNLNTVKVVKKPWYKLLFKKIFNII